MYDNLKNSTFLIGKTLEELEDVAGKIKAKGMDVYT